MHNPLAPLVAKLYEAIIHNLNYNIPRHSNLRYVGLTIYHAEMEERTHYTAHRSVSLYINQYQTVKISHDDFSGYAFPSISGNEEGLKASGKSFNYLRLFFPDIDIVDEPFDQFFRFDASEGWQLQLILLYQCEPTQEFELAIVNEIRSYLADTSLECDISLPSTRVIKDASLIIIDLIRNKDRHDNPHLKYADTSITRKLIFDIAAIISSYGFRICGNTGDGFFFLSERQDSEPIRQQQINALLTELDRYLERITAYLKPLNQQLLHHRLRILIDEVETVFEMDDGNKMMSKLYFSTDLDAKFAAMMLLPKYNEKHLLITGSPYKGIEWVSPTFERKNHD